LRYYSLVLICLALAPLQLLAQADTTAVDDAEAAIVKSDLHSARIKLDEYLKVSPNDARALFDAAYVADAENRTDDATALYRRATIAEPNSFRAHLSLGLLLARVNKPDEARTELIAATTLDPGDLGVEMKARAWRALAAIDSPGRPGGNAATASNDLAAALKLSPETPDDTLLAAELAESAGDRDAAEAAYHRALNKDPNSAAAFAGLAHLLIQQKKYPEAEQLLHDALAKSPDDPALNAQYAAVLTAEDKAEALPVLEKLYAAHPDDPAITRMLEQVYATAGDYENSDKLCLKLLHSTPNDSVVLVDHGQNLVHLLKYAEAFTAFQKAAQLDTNNGDAWNGLAFTASRTQQPLITLDALTKRAALLPETPATLFLRATAYDSLHDKKNAIAAYKQFLAAAAGKFPDQEWQAKQRLALLAK
jgi:tetratricopeptide (TPR) repeat protein